MLVFEGDKPDRCSCNIAGCLAILPTVLQLDIGLLREMSSKPMDKKNNVVVNACIGCIKSVFSSTRFEDDKRYTEWQKLLQSSLATVINQSKPGIYFHTILNFDEH